MSERKFCRICAGPVINDLAWFDLERLGRFWLCPRHKVDVTFLTTEEVGWIAIGDNWRLVLGPYPYERGGLS